MEEKVITKSVRIELDDDAENFYQTFKGLYGMGRVIRVSIGERNRRVTIYTMNEKYSYQGDYAKRLIEKINDYNPYPRLYGTKTIKAIEGQLYRSIKECIEELREYKANDTGRVKDCSAKKALDYLWVEYKKIKDASKKQD